MSDGRKRLPAFMAVNGRNGRSWAPVIMSDGLQWPSDLIQSYVRRPPGALRLNSILCPTVVFKPERTTACAPRRSTTGALKQPASWRRGALVGLQRRGAVAAATRKERAQHAEYECAKKIETSPDAVT
jgi:hypothetical protein